MKQFLNYKFLALVTCFVVAACNNGDKTTETTTTNEDTTQGNLVTTDNSQTMDVTKVAPDFYKVVKDTMGIRVLEVNYKPGDSSAMHSHPDLAAITTGGGELTFYGKDGAKMVNEIKTGTTLIRPAETHGAKNTGKTTVKVMLVEVNRPTQTTSQDAATDATKAAPTVYKLKNDTLGIRVIEINFRPGQSAALHSHPDNVLYVVDGGTAEFTAKDGTKNAAELKSGMVMVAPPESHSVKNTGKTTMKGFLVEVNRPAN